MSENNTTTTGESKPVKRRRRKKSLPSKSGAAEKSLEGTSQKATLPVLGNDGDRPTVTKDPFAPENIRLSQNFGDVVGVEKVLTDVPVCKPHGQWFVRVHPDESMRVQTAILELKSERERETYLVAQPLLNELWNEVRPVDLFTAVNRQGKVFLWPVPLPGSDGKDNPWWKAAREAAALAMTRWIRIKANLNQGCYELFQAPTALEEPEWPDADMAKLIKLGFGDFYINDRSHPVLKKLRGEV